MNDDELTPARGVSGHDIATARTGVNIIMPGPRAALGAIEDALVLEQLEACQVFPWRHGQRHAVFGAQLSEIERVVAEWRAGRGHFDSRTGQHRAVVVGAAAVRIYDMLLQQRPER